MSITVDAQDVLGTKDFCRNFPKQPSPLLPRESLFNHIQNIFSKASNIAYLEGNALSGKSEFLANYMRRNLLTSLGVFLSPGDIFFYSPEYVRLALSEQIYWIINKQPAKFDSVDPETFTRLLHQLQRKARANPITFVLDGLSDPNTAEHRLRDEILKLFPMNQGEFRFLISGSPELLPSLNLDKYKYKTVPLMEIGVEEATAYFLDNKNITAKDVTDIRKICGGSIGLISKFKGLIESGASVDELLQKKENAATDLMEFEWSLIPADEVTHNILAYIAFSNRQLSLLQLSELVELNCIELLDKVKKCRVIELAVESQLISIRSNDQRSFLRKKLSHKESLIQEEFISQLLKDPDGLDAVRYLPGQLMSAGHFGDLIKRLDNAHFCKLLTSQKSLRLLKGDSDLGLSAAKKSNDESAQAKFSLNGSVISGLTFSVGTKNRIGALIKLGEVERAIELAFIAPTNEEKLQLLAATAKFLYDEKLAIKTEISKEVGLLLLEIDAKALGHLAFEIACDLLVVDFDTAIDFFNRANVEQKEVSQKNNSLDNKINKSSSEESLPEEKSLGTVEMKMSEHYHRMFIDALGGIVDRLSADQLLVGLEKTNELSNKLVVLKQWISRRRKDKNSWKVADKALDITLKDLSRSPRLEDLRAIAVVLPYIEDDAISKTLVDRIEAQLGTKLFLGTNAESVRLQMLLERVKYKYLRDETELSLLELFMKIEDVVDPSVRAACFSWMLYSLQQLPNPSEFEKKTSLVSQTTASLMTAIDSLLISSADHYQAAKSAIYALARADTKLAFNLISRFNTEERRDRGYVTFIREIVTSKIYVTQPGVLIKAVNCIEDEKTRSIEIVKLMHAIAIHCERKEVIDVNLGVIGLWRNIRIANVKFQAIAAAYKIFAICYSNRDKAEELLLEMKGIWSSIMVDWVRTDVGYYFVGDIAKIDKPLAVIWLDHISTEEKNRVSMSRDFTLVLNQILNLLVRCYGSLASDDLDLNDADFLRVAKLINSAPVIQDRMSLWCDLGLRFYFFGKRSISKRICETYVLKFFDESFVNNEYIEESLILDAAPLLFLTHNASAILRIEKISQQSRRDRAKGNICKVLLRKQSDSDAYRTPDNWEYDLTNDDAATIVSILQTMTMDSLIFHIIREMTASLVAKRNVNLIRRNQVADFLLSLEKIVDRTLPDSNNIRHDGFKLAAIAHIYKARMTLGLTVTKEQWVLLYAQARNISNISDRAIVTTFVSVCARPKTIIFFPTWLSDVKNDLEEIPTDVDKVERYQWVAELVESMDKTLASALVKEALVLTKAMPDEDGAFEKQKKLLDLAFNMDPDFAEKLIEQADKDEARTFKKAEHLKQINLRKIQKEAAENPKDILDASIDTDSLIDLCGSNLASLNGGRIIPRPVDEFRNLFAYAGSVQINTSYPIWSWIIENAVRKIGPNSNGLKLVSNFHLGACNSAELVLALAGVQSSKMSESSFTSDGIIKPGDRDAVFKFIGDWAFKNDGKEIFISDPFFGPEDLDVVHKIAEMAPSSTLRILTSRDHLRKEIPTGLHEAGFNTAWRELCDVSPPDTEIIVIGKETDGLHPVHDRWIVTFDSGLRLGTSTNSIGCARISELSTLDESTSLARFNIISDFANRRIRSWEGVKLQLSTFEIS